MQEEVISQVWYHLYNLKDLKSTHGGVLLLVTDKACNFTKCNIPPWVFFTFLKLYKWYQIAQIISFNEFSSRKAWSVLLFYISVLVEVSVVLICFIGVVSWSTVCFSGTAVSAVFLCKQREVLFVWQHSYYFWFRFIFFTEVYWKPGWFLRKY